MGLRPVELQWFAQNRQNFPAICTDTFTLQQYNAWTRWKFQSSQECTGMGVENDQLLKTIDEEIYAALYGTPPALQIAHFDEVE